MLKAILVFLIGAMLAVAAPPVPVIFDTDIGNDVDDCLALAILHAFESRGEARIAAVTIAGLDKSCRAKPNASKSRSRSIQVVIEL